MKTRKVMGALWAVLIVVCCLFIPVSAATGETGSIALELKAPDTNVPLVGVEFQLYFVAEADVSEGGVSYQYVSPYDECHMDLGNLQDAYLPTHLMYFATSRDLPYTVQSTDKNGVLAFEDLMAGVYLLVPAKGVVNGYRMEPFVANIPHYDEANQRLQYDIDATAKIEIWKEESSTTYISVRKEWESNQNHPDQVTVVLLRDQVEYETVTLNDRNDWYYRWDELSKNYTWDVVEKQVPDGYTVGYATTSNTVVITNRSVTPPEPGEPTDPPDELVQTGQLNWPVPVFSVLGLVLFAIGWSILNFGKTNAE